MASLIASPNSSEVTYLLNSLENAIKDNSLSKESHLTVLERLKVLGRNPQDAEPVFATRGIGTLATIGFDLDVPELSREALRCVANAMLLKPSVRQALVDMECGGKLAKMLQANRNEDEFLSSRILFLLTYGTSINFQELILKHDLARTINKNIVRHAHTSTHRRTAASASRSVEEETALSETLKLLFNLMHNQPSLESHFTPSLPSLLTMVQNEDPRPPLPLQPPLNHLVNALLNFKLCQQIVFPDFDPTGNIQTLIRILDEALVAYPETLLDVTIAPLLTLIRRFYDAAPEVVKSHVQYLLLPSELERDQALGKSSSVCSRLLYLSSSPHMASTRDSISSLMFELSGKDAQQFIYNVGYGYAAGFLVNHNIPVPNPALRSQDSVVSGSRGSGVPNTDASRPITSSRGVNYVTGQYVDQERATTNIQMTEDEKLREAERLFVTFERLQKSGVITIQNPMRTAIESGRFEEVD